MSIMVGCGVLLLAGVVAGALWGDRAWVGPSEALERSPLEVVRRFAWHASIMMTAGIVAGITMIGGGGRLAMRLLAVTAGDDAQGRITEADETVGEISLDGTIGFIVFNGIIGGVAAAGVYLLIRRFLPIGWLRGVTFGLGLLIVVGTTIDPLRADNPDFDIVGPGWLAALVFSLVVVGFAVVLSGVTARMSSWLPLISTQRAALVRYAVPAAVAAVAFSITTILVVLCVAVVLATRWRPLTRAIRSRRFLIAGRVTLIGIVVIAAPNAISNLADIASR